MESNNIYQNISRPKPSLNRIPGKKVWMGVLLLLILISATILYINSDSPVMLMVNGEPAAVVAGKDQVNSTVDRIKGELEKQYSITLNNMSTKIEYDKDFVGDNRKPVDDQQLYMLIKDRLDWQVDSWAISIKGESKLFLSSKEDAQKALDEIKKYYLPKGENVEMTVEETGFAEDVAVEQAKCNFKEIKTSDAALVAMVRGLDTIVTHTVKNGDSLWTIAHANDMTVAGLREINPQLKSDFLKPGQTLNLVKSEPLLTIVSTVTTKVEEKIAFKTVYESDTSLWRGQQTVKQPGVAGAREVTYRLTKKNDQEVARETLSETIIKEPVTQIVRNGAKVMVASRGDGGSGILSWPIRGRLTSMYGKRGREFHTGLDIDGVTGDPVYAAEAGVVLDAAWAGNLGRCITIDHGKGLSTRYAHLSAFNVSIGQTVKRGDLIGKVGNTGRSTGSHLHFEVRVNGNHRNPLGYLD